MGRINGTRVSGRLRKQIRRIKLIAFDFDGVLTDNGVYILEDGSEAVRCNRSDGIGLAKLAGLGIVPVVISTEKNRVVAARCRKLNVSCVHGAEDKLSVMKSVLRAKRISLDQTAFVGNDTNDLSCLRAVALPIVVRDAHPALLKGRFFRTKARGGHGAVREICDLFERVLVPERR